MSRQENYFYPVKDLLSQEQRRKLIEHFYEYEKNHSFYKVEEQQTLMGMWSNDEYIRQQYNTLGYVNTRSSYERFKNNITHLVERSHNWGVLRLQLVTQFIQNTNVDSPENDFISLLELKIKNVQRQDKIYGNDATKANAKFHSSAQNSSLSDGHEFIDDIVNLYGGEKACFLHTVGSGENLTKHIDPGRKCCITFPLIPDYSNYRSCEYYDSFEETEPAHIVDYSKIKSCVLLNNQKIHKLETNTNGIESLCFQIDFMTTDYITIRKMLSNKGLLI
jgi:hypothetical protein